MENHGLFSTLFIQQIKNQIELDDSGRGRMASADQTWYGRDASSRQSLWQSFLKPVLGYLEFVSPDADTAPGIYPLFEDWGFSNCITALCLIPPGADLDEVAIGRFWPGLLIAELKRRRLTWGILTDGARWRLYSTRSVRPFEDYVELPLAEALQGNNEAEYTLFERFFHRDSFLPESQAEGGAEEGTQSQGIVKCRLDRDGERSEEVLEKTVKNPLLYQVDEVLQYLCNGFIQDTPKAGTEYTEEERAEIFQSAVKLLYRCLFLFYAEARRLLPTDEAKRAAYERLSIQSLCREARRFRWGQRKDFGGYDLWQHLKGLVAAVNEGDIEYGILGYNGGLFDDEEEKYLGRHHLRNDFLWRALYLLAYVEPAENNPQTEYAVPYEDLEVRHLGELYENLLEYTVILADADRIRRRTKRGVDILLATKTTPQPGDSLIRKGEVFFGESALERKQTGSYYTPESLVHFLNEKSIIVPLQYQFSQECRPRLEAFLQQVCGQSDLSVRQGAARSAIALVDRFVQETVLSFKVCDPAMGSGHFLVNAANQMAGLVVELFSEIPEVSGTQTHLTCQPNHWRRLVTRHCLHGVDLNPLAVDLAKLSLWLNSFAGSHKLTFLDHHLRSGNSLMGLRSVDNLRTIPQRRKDSKKKTERLLFDTSSLFQNQRLNRETLHRIGELAEDNTEQMRDLFQAAREKGAMALSALADLYTGYLVENAISPAQYAEVFEAILTGDDPQRIGSKSAGNTWTRIQDLANNHRFFHWAVEFPDVFSDPGSGFNATVGNPPWDTIKPNSQEFYSTYDADFRSYGKQEAEKVARQLQNSHPEIQRKWIEYCAACEEQSAYFKEPAVYSALGKGDLNTYKLFLERFYSLLRSGGRLGIVVPSGLYTDQGCQPLRELFFEKSRIQFLYGFENRWPEVFPAVDNRFKFVLYCTEKGGKTKSFPCAFMQHNPERLALIEAQALAMTPEQVRKFSPGSLSIMEFNHQRDIDITTKLYGNWPLLGETLEDNWNVKFTAELHMTNDSHLFRTREWLTDHGAVEIGGQRWLHPKHSGLTSSMAEDMPYETLKRMALTEEIELFIPLWEGKMIWLLDGLFETSRNWVSYSEVHDYLGPALGHTQTFRGAFRDIAASTNERTFISTVIPPSVCGHTIPTVILSDSASNVDRLYLSAVFSSFCCDFLMRYKVTNHMTYFFLESLPIPRRPNPFIGPVAVRAARLICTESVYSDLWKESFQSQWAFPDYWYPSTNYGDAYGPAHEREIRLRLMESSKKLSPKWEQHMSARDWTTDRRDMGDRAQLRAEIDAYVSHLYGLKREDLEFILDTFPVLRSKEEKIFGEYMTKRKCLEEYDRIAKVL